MPIAPFLIPIIAGGIQTVANVIGSIHDRNVAKRNTNLTVRENQKLAEKAYQIEQQNIAKQNEYNSPANQMDRFRKAGLNPSLIYSQGTPGNQQGIAKYNAPTLQYNYKPGFKGSDFSPITSIMADAQNIKNSITQGKIMKAEATIKEASAKYADFLADSQSQLVFNQSQESMFRRVFSENEFKQFFTIDQATNKATLRPDMAEQFSQAVISKVLMPTLEYGQKNLQMGLTATQQMIAEKNLEMLDMGLPWMQPIINFLRLILGK